MKQKPKFKIGIKVKIKNQIGVIDDFVWLEHLDGYYYKIIVDDNWIICGYEKDIKEL